MVELKNIYPIGIGTFRIDLTNKNQSMNALIKSFELGQNYLYTSYLYEDGKVMEFLSEFIKKVDRNKIFITTNIEPKIEKAADIEEQLDKYLEMMNLKYVDCLMLHTVLHSKLSLLETYHEMNRMLEIGKAKCLGLANSTLQQLIEVNAKYPISIYDGMYNLECKINEDIGIIDYCKENNIIFCAYQVLRRNRTANKNYPLLVELAKKYNKTKNQIILNWILKEKGIKILVKTTNIDRIDENIEATQFVMDKSDYEKLNLFRAKEFDDLVIDWEGTGGITIDQIPNQFE